ncbi:MAG: hypothetical protein NTV23_07145 [Propionibacteriales bacterium]|nr:hypothetical protein [Propionibacteriales bacterium]
MFKRLTALLAGAALVAIASVSLGTSAQAAPSPKSNPLLCFDGASEGSGNGTCVRQGSSFTLTNPEPGDYSGVYVENQSLGGLPVRSLVLSYTYAGTVGGGSPRISVPLAGGGYAYVDAACDANLDGVVNLAEPGCIISDSNGFYGLAADYTGVTGTSYAFIVADQPGTVVVSEIKLGRTPPGKNKG